MAKVKLGTQACPVTFKMEEYNHKAAKNMECDSDSFYTHNKGYKMCLSIYAGSYGDSEGTHLSVFLYLMKGSHDDELTWSLRGKFEIKLLNQISDSEHHSRTLTYDDDDEDNDDSTNRVTQDDTAPFGWGYHKFIFNEDLQRILQHVSI